MRCALASLSKTVVIPFTKLYTLLLSKRSSPFIDPADFSTSFRRVCLNDFAGSENEWVPAHLQRNKHLPFALHLQEHELRLFHVLMSLQAERDLYSLNLIVVGGLFNEFMCQLFPPPEMEGVSMPPHLDSIRQALYSQTNRRLPKNNPLSNDKDSIRVVNTVQLLECALAGLDHVDTDECEYMGRHFETFFRALDPDKVVILS